uniref:Uncharacterized protein n=1 Tax=Rhizophora mucronata TaxID=61149 RepID=A0A2P2R2J8_RHIMU
MAQKSFLWIFVHLLKLCLVLLMAFDVPWEMLT